MFNSVAGGAEFKSVHLHELPTYDNLAEVSLEKMVKKKNKKNTEMQLCLIYYKSAVWLVMSTTIYSRESYQQMTSITPSIGPLTCQ